MESVELINRPWRSSLAELVASASESILIAAPYIKEREAEWLCGFLQPGIEIHTLARVDSIAVSNESLDIAALRRLATASRKARLTALPNLHAKVFVADQKAAIVTSGNLTRGGLDANIEYGVALREPDLARRVREDMLSFAKLGSPVSVRKIARLARLEKELREARANVQNSASDEAKRRFDKVMKRAKPAIAAIEVGSRSPNAVFGEALKGILSNGPLPTKSIQPIVREWLPNLCDDTLDYMINGVGYGKKWKHRVRNAQRHLRDSNVITYDAASSMWMLKREGGNAA